MGDEPTPTAGVKLVRTFLKRGEGVQKRVFGPQLRHAQKEKQQAHAQDDVHGAQTEQPVVGDRRTQLRKVQDWNNDPFVSKVSSSQQDLGSKGQLYAAPEEYEAGFSNSGCEHNGKVPLSQAKPKGVAIFAVQDDLELEEFEALEQQLKKDVRSSKAAGVQPINATATANTTGRAPVASNAFGNVAQTATPPLVTAASTRSQYQHTQQPASLQAPEYGKQPRPASLPGYQGQEEEEGDEWEEMGEDEYAAVCSAGGVLRRSTAGGVGVGSSTHALLPSGVKAAPSVSARGGMEQHASSQGAPQEVAAKAPPSGALHGATSTWVQAFADDRQGWGHGKPQPALTLAHSAQSAGLQPHQQHSLHGGRPGGQQGQGAGELSGSLSAWAQPASAASHGYAQGDDEYAFDDDEPATATSPLMENQPEAYGPTQAQGQPAHQQQQQQGLTQPFVRSLFTKQQQQGSAKGSGSKSGRGGAATSPPGLGAALPPDIDKLRQQLEADLSRAAQERATLGRLRTDLEKAANKLEAERQAWERKQSEEESGFRGWRESEEARLAREKRVLEKQSKALLKLPTKKERSAVEAVEAVLEAERKEGRAREARHKLTVERLRRQLLEQQDKNRELREEVRWHEARALQQGWGAGGGGPGKADGLKGPPGSSSSGGDRPAGVSRGCQAELGASTLLAALAGPPGAEDRMQKEAPPPVTSYSVGARTIQPSITRVAPKGSVTGPRQPAQPSAPELHSHRLSISEGLGEQQQGSLPPPPGILPASGVVLQGSQGSGAAAASRGAVLHSGLQSGRHSSQPSAAASWADAFGSDEGGEEGGQAEGRTGRSSRSFCPPPTASLPGAGQQHGRGYVGEVPAGEELEEEASFGQQQGNSRMQGRYERQELQPVLQGKVQPPSLPGKQQQLGLPTHTQALNSSSTGATGSAELHSHALPIQHHHHSHTLSSVSSGAGSDSGSRATDLPGHMQGLNNVRPAYQPTQGQGHHQHSSGSNAAARSTSAGSATTSSLGESVAGSGRAPGARAPAAPTAAQAPGMSQGHTLQPPPPPASSAGVLPAGSHHHPGLTLDAVKREVRHADGKLERFLASGKRVVIFANGTVKEVLPGGATTISFPNGDIKRQLPDGATEYYYCQVSTWHTTHQDGVEVFHFPSGQREAHHPGGMKEILFPDGVARRVTPDGVEQDVPVRSLSLAVQRPVPELL